jgi:hypothetical protein
MATRKKQNDKNGLDEAMRQLVQAQAGLTAAQAILTQNQASFLARISETDRVNSERFARIEAILSQLIHLVQELPEAVKERIGFKPDNKKPAFPMASFPADSGTQLPEREWIAREL